MSGTPKTGGKATSNFAKVTLPMIRKVLPTLVASEILSVQPMQASTGQIFTTSMGLGPPVCLKCNLIGFLDNNAVSHPWRCFNCGDFDLKASLWTLNQDFQKVIESRSKLFKQRKIIPMDNPSFIVKKLFMFLDDDRDPNERYREWLETNVGMQGVEWNWDIDGNNFNSLVVSFIKEEHALLFKLSCT